jgi:SpoVK/Ycf46/Vps4 family AAA+-type ATPase
MITHKLSTEGKVNDMKMENRSNRPDPLTVFAELVEQMHSIVNLEDSVIPDTVRHRLPELANHINLSQATKSKSFDHSVLPSTIVLLAGADSTGISTAATAIANHLKRALYRVNLNSVVSKYFGETEKNLRHLFDAAEDGGAILFFDEADALFGKRSEVKDSHDRFATIEVNYLLQRIESFQGLIILSSKMTNNIDPAFLRHFHHIIEI